MLTLFPYTIFELLLTKHPLQQNAPAHAQVLCCYDLLKFTAFQLQPNDYHQ